MTTSPFSSGNPVLDTILLSALQLAVLTMVATEWRMALRVGRNGALWRPNPLAVFCYEPHLEGMSDSEAIARLTRLADETRGLDR